jgi:hypothetical protein
VPAYLVAVVRDDLTTDGVVQSERADDGLILLVALLAGIALASTSDGGSSSDDGRARSREGVAAVACGRANALIGVGARAACPDRRARRVRAGVTGTIENQWDDFTTVKSDDQSDPSRVLRSNSGNRWVWWKEAAGAFSDEPVKGWGAGSFPLVHRRYRRERPAGAPGAQRAAPVPRRDRPRGRGAGARRPRAARLGGRHAAAALAEGRERRYVAALACASLAWGVHMWFDWDSDIPGVTLPLLIFLGVLAARPPAPPTPSTACPARTTRAPPSARAGRAAARAR